MNWGWKIAIFMTAFIAFIMSMVIMAFGNKIDLVSEDYYQKELDYQEVIDAKSNAIDITSQVSIKQNENDLELTFPDSFNETITEGKISFYRADNSALDQTKTLNLVDFKQLITNEGFEFGYYSVFIDFTAEGKAYHIEKSLLYL